MLGDTQLSESLFFLSLLCFGSICSTLAQDDSNKVAPSPSIPPPGALPPPPPPPPPPPSLRRGNLNGPRDEQNGNDTENVLLMVLPMLLVVLVVSCATVGIYYMVMRAKYGAVCCFNPHLNYRLQENELKFSEGDVVELDIPRTGTPPPDYTPSSIAPPVYQDALHDVILSTDDDRLLDYLQTSPAILVADEDVSENLQNSRLTLLSTNSAEDSDNVHVIQNSET